MTLIKVSESNFGEMYADVVDEGLSNPAHNHPVDIPKLYTKYRQYNAKYFQNKLPRVEIKFGNMQGEVAGLTSYQAYKQGDETWVDPDSISITINNMFKSPNVKYGASGGIDSILLHEMSHVLMGITGKPNEAHGINFKRWLQKLAVATGIPYADLMGKQQAAEDIELRRVKTLAGI